MKKLSEIQKDALIKAPGTPRADMPFKTNTINSLLARDLVREDSEGVLWWTTAGDLAASEIFTERSAMLAAPKWEATKAPAITVFQRDSRLSKKLTPSRRSDLYAEELFRAYATVVEVIDQRLITKSEIESRVNLLLAPLGWQVLGRGASRSAWLAEDGYVYKIANRTGAQQSAVEYAACKTFAGQPWAPEGVRLWTFEVEESDAHHFWRSYAITRMKRYEHAHVGWSERYKLEEQAEKIADANGISDMHSENFIITGPESFKLIDLGMEYYDGSPLPALPAPRKIYASSLKY